METPYTDAARISEIHQDVRDYLEWIQRTDSELRAVDRNPPPMILKPVNRHMVDVPVF